MVDLKMLAEWEDLLSNFVFENGFDVTASQTLCRSSKKQAMRDASMPLLQLGVGLTLAARSCLACAATCLSEAVASNGCNDELPAFARFYLDRPRATILQEWKGKAGALGNTKYVNFCERRKASSGSSAGTF